jgi:hypothetical protein
MNKLQEVAVVLALVAAVNFIVVPLVYVDDTAEVYGTVTNVQGSWYNFANVTVVYHGQTYYATVRCDGDYHNGSSFPLFYHPALLYLGNSSLFSDELQLPRGC